VIADSLPSFLINPTGGLEAKAATPSSRYRHETTLQDYGPAPDFTGTQRWFNSPPLTIAGLRGKVVLVDFWTYTCINCLRTLPEVRMLDAKYRDAGLRVVGVHTPEFGFEKVASNVERAVRVNKLTYPVVQDNEYAVWNGYSNQYWPAKYLVDAKGHVRFAHFGEGGEAEIEAAIRTLLAEAGAKAAPRPVAAADVLAADPSTSTPETYLGSARAKGFVQDPIRPGVRDFGALPRDIPQDGFAYGGTWTVEKESASAGPGASLAVRFGARRVYLVMSGHGDVGVTLDGKAQPAIRVRRQQLYTLVDLPEARSGLLTLRFPPGVSGFAFTFG
jgi:thiol-disulfide isomerase/thioredoxin